MRCIVAAFLSVLSHGFADAQQSPRQLWTQPVGSDTQWAFASSGSFLVAIKERISVATDSSFADTLETTVIHAIEQQSGSKKWTYQPPTPALIQGIDQVPNTPYMILRGIPLTIIDATDGRTIIDPSLFTEVFSYGLLKDSKHLWVEGTIGNSRTIVMFEFPATTRLWSKSEYFIETRKEKKPEQNRPARFKISLPPAEKPAAPPMRMLCDPVIDNRGNMIIITGDGLSETNIYKVSIDNGNLQWKSSAPFVDKKQLLPVDTEPPLYKLIGGTNEFFYLRERWMTACSFDNGSSLWQAPLTTKGKRNLQTANVTPKGTLYSTDKSIGLVDANGKELIDLPGSILTADAGAKLYAFSKQNKNLYEIDKSTGEMKVLKESVDFKNIDNPERIELGRESIVLYSTVNIMFLNFDGSVQYVVHNDEMSEFKTDFFQAIDPQRPMYAVDFDTSLLFYVDKKKNMVTAFDISKKN